MKMHQEPPFISQVSVSPLFSISEFSRSVPFVTGPECCLFPSSNERLWLIAWQIKGWPPTSPCHMNDPIFLRVEHVEKLGHETDMLGLIMSILAAFLHICLSSSFKLSILWSQKVAPKLRKTKHYSTWCPGPGPGHFNPRGKLEKLRKRIADEATFDFYTAKKA